PSGSQETCLGGQCWDVGTLGLVLPILSTRNLVTLPPQKQGLPTEDLQYDMLAPQGGPLTVNTCAGKTVDVIPPNVRKASGLGNNPGICPNGDSSIAHGGKCTVPADANLNP